jgi:hypothetical protein
VDTRRNKCVILMTLNMTEVDPRTLERIHFCQVSHSSPSWSSGSDVQQETRTKWTCDVRPNEGPTMRSRAPGSQISFQETNTRRTTTQEQPTHEA